MNAPLVSLLIPAYNAAPWIEETLASALAQTHPRCEIIVVDDGSRDDTLVIARAVAARHPERIRVETQSNAGAAAARNRALRLARGDFIQYLDADDLLTPDKISAQVALLTAAGTDCVASCRWGRFTRDPAEVAFVDHDVFRDFTPVEFLLLHTARHGTMHPAAWLVPAEIARRAGPWDERLSLNDDGEYFARVVLAARRIAFSPVGASLYRSGLSGSLSRHRSRRALESLTLSVELVAARLRTSEDSPRVRQALADYWQRLVYVLYPDASDLRRRAEVEVRTLGGSQLRPEMGRRERALARLIGWRLARRIRGLLD